MCQAPVQAHGGRASEAGRAPVPADLSRVPEAGPWAGHREGRSDRGPAPGPSGGSDFDGETDRCGGESATHISARGLGRRPAFVTPGENWSCHRLPRTGRGEFRLRRRTRQAPFMSVWLHTCSMRTSQNDSRLVPGALTVPTGVEKLHRDRQGGQGSGPNSAAQPPCPAGPCRQSPLHSPADASHTCPQVSFLSSSAQPT